MEFLMLKRIFSKRGSIFFSLMASGAVAATIVATHQITQNFNIGSSISRKQAVIIGQKALSLATMMVTQNIILCSSKLDSDGHIMGCSSDPLDPPEDLPEEFLTGMKLERDGFTLSPSRPDPPPSDQFGRVVKLERENIKKGSPIYGVEDITWSLKTWMDPQISSVFNVMYKGYLCQHTTTHQIIEGECESVKDTQSKVEITALSDSAKYPDDYRKCQNEDNTTIPNSVCNYFSVSDFDENMVYISVRVPYHGSSDQGEVRKTLVLRAAVRRPVPVLSFSTRSRPNCSQRCEAALSPTGVNENPRCVGLSDYGVDDLADSRYRNSVTASSAHLKVTNWGPGILYDLELKREDIMNSSNQVLSQAMFHPELDSNDGMLGPRESGYLEDKIPCYASTQYRVNVTEVSCVCRLPLTSTPVPATQAQQDACTQECQEEVFPNSTAGAITTVRALPSQWVSRRTTAPLVNSSTSTTARVGNQLFVTPQPVVTGSPLAISITSPVPIPVRTPAQQQTGCEQQQVNLFSAQLAFCPPPSSP